MTGFITYPIIKNLDNGENKNNGENKKYEENKNDEENKNTGRILLTVLFLGDLLYF